MLVFISTNTLIFTKLRLIINSHYNSDIIVHGYMHATTATTGVTMAITHAAMAFNHTD